MRLSGTAVCLATCSLNLISQQPIKPQLPAPKAQLAAPKDLPVRKVVLYKNGVGYFEHAGFVNGNQRVAIDFTSPQLNDVLQSLTVLDEGGGRIAGVNYNSTTPLAEQLKTLSLGMNEDPTSTELFGALRGQRVEVTGVPGGRISGRLMSIEARAEKIGSDENASLHRQVLSHCRRRVGRRPRHRTHADAERASHRFQPAGRTRPLPPVAFHHTLNGLRHLTLDALGPASASFTSVTSAKFRSGSPPTASSFRANANGNATVQGWAVVDNTVGADWDNVQLRSSPALRRASSSRSRSRSTPAALRSPSPPKRRPHRKPTKPQKRPRIPTRLNWLQSSMHRRLPQLFRVPWRRLPINRLPSKDVGTALAQVNRSVPATAVWEWLQATPAEVSIARATPSLKATYPPTPSTTSSSTPSPSPSPSTRTSPRWCRSSSRNCPPSTSPSGAATTRALFAPSGLKTNPSSPSTPAASPSSKAANLPAKDCSIPSIPARRRLLSYAADQAMRVKITDVEGKRTLHHLQIHKGLVIERYMDVASMTYSATNSADEDRLVLLEHPRRINGWSLDDGVKADETTPDLYRFKRGGQTAFDRETRSP